LKALGRRIGVEVAVNTSFNVGGPIAQTPVQALDTLRRAKGMDGVFMFSEEGQVIAAWTREPGTRAAARIPEWLVEWQSETNAAVSYPERGRVEQRIDGIHMRKPLVGRGAFGASASENRPGGDLRCRPGGMSLSGSKAE